MASESRPGFQGDREPQADSEFQSNSESDSGSESPWGLSLSSTEDIQDMRPGSPDSSDTWFEDIQDMRPGSPDSSDTCDNQDMSPGSPSPVWIIVKVTRLDKSLVPRILLEGIGTIWIPTVEGVRTRATDLDAETVRPYIPGECWLPPTWSVHCATYKFKSSTDKYVKTTIGIRSLVSLEEIDGCIGAGNIIIPLSFPIWRKHATVQNASLSKGQDKYSEPEETEMASCVVATPRRRSL